MKDSLYICIKNPFTQRDFERMGIEALEQYFEVRILDCTGWLMPRALRTRGYSSLRRQNLCLINSLRELKKLLKNSSGGIALDYVGPFSIKAIWLFHLLKSNGFKLIVVDSGAYPLPDTAAITGTVMAKMLEALRSGNLQRHANAVMNRLLLKCLPDQTPDYAFVSGTSWTNNPRFSRAATKIPAHSFDYEKYLQLRMLPEDHGYDYAVYLDEDIADHEDNAEMGLKAPVSAHRFFGSLAKFFDEFEAVSHIPIVIAGYPSERSDRSRHFGGRKLIYGETAQLIRNANVVFAHASTAISYAVLWRRPLVFLTSNEMTNSWYQPWIEAPCRILKSPILNIDDVSGKIDMVKWQEIDQASYSRYEHAYIKSEGSPEKSLWDIFLSVNTDSGSRIQPGCD